MKHPLLLEGFITSYMDVIETLPPKKEYCDMCNRSVEAFLLCDLYLCADCYSEVTEACLRKAVEDLRETLPADQYDALMQRIERLERELRWIMAVSNSIRERLGLHRERYEALHQYLWKWGRGRTYMA